jgi:hypothetical protein
VVRARIEIGASGSAAVRILRGLVRLTVGLFCLALILVFLLNSGEKPAKQVEPKQVEISKPSVRPVRTIKAPEQITEYLKPLKTASGDPFDQLVKRLGLSIAYIEAVPIEAFERSIWHASDQPGDWIVTIVIDGVPKRKLPCNLNHWQSGNGITRSTSEVPLRDGRFLVDENAEFLFWATTGRCAY